MFNLLDTTCSKCIEHDKYMKKLFLLSTLFSSIFFFMSKPWSFHLTLDWHHSAREDKLFLLTWVHKHLCILSLSLPLTSLALTSCSWSILIVKKLRPFCIGETSFCSLCLLPLFPGGGTCSLLPDLHCFQLQLNSQKPFWFYLNIIIILIFSL